jgi:hypothetical protein
MASFKIFLYFMWPKGIFQGHLNIGVFDESVTKIYLGVLGPQLAISD